MFAFVIQDKLYRPGPDFRRKSVRGLAHNGSIFSRVGASDNPGAVHSGGKGEALDIEILESSGHSKEVTSVIFLRGSSSGSADQG